MQQLCISKDIYIIYTRIMNKVNVFETVGECLQQWGKCLRQWGNVCNSGEIEYALRNL